MTIDSILRTIGALACIYTFGLLVTVTSTAALNAVAHEPKRLLRRRLLRDGGLSSRNAFRRL